MLDTQLEELRIPLPSVKLETDPHIMEDINSMFLVQQIHRSLFRFSSDGTIQPDLAEQIEFSNDGRIMRIWIKAGQTFSDGSPITATHVVKSLRRPFQVGAGIAADLAYLEGARTALEHKNGELLGINERGPLEISISMLRPVDLLPTHLALPDLSILKIGPDGKWDSSATSGFYTISERSERGIYLTPRSADAPKVRILPLSTDKAFKAALNGEVDTVEQYSFSSDELDQLIQAGWRTTVHSLSYENFLLLNPIHLNRKVRELISAVINSADLVTALGDGMQPAHGLIPPNLLGALTEPYPRPQPTEMDIMTTIKIHFNINNRLHQKAAHWISNQLAEYGIEAMPTPLEHDDFYEHLLKRKSTAIIAGKGLDYPDGLANLTYFRTDVANHFLFMENSDLDRRLSDLTFISQPEKESTYREVQKAILAHRTVIPLFFGHTTSGLWSKRVRSVPSHPFGFQFLKLEEIR